MRRFFQRVESAMADQNEKEDPRRNGVTGLRSAVKVRFGTGWLVAVAMLAGGSSMRAQANAGQGSAVSGPGMSRTVPEQMEETLYLNSVSQQGEQNEVLTAMRNIMDPSVKIFLVPSQNAIVMKATAEQIALAKKLLRELDRPKKVYRLTYTFTERDGGKAVGVQHFGMVLASGQRTQLKQGSRVPITTATVGSPSQAQVAYVDVGMNFDATISDMPSGFLLKTKVEQSSIADEKSNVGIQDPVIRQTSLEGTAVLTVGKPLVLGSLDVPSSTRHVDVEVVAELVR